MSFLGLCLASKLNKKNEECKNLEKKVIDLEFENKSLDLYVRSCKNNVSNLKMREGLLKNDIKTLEEDVASKDGIIIQYGKDVSDLKNKLKEAEGKASISSDNFKVLSIKYSKAVDSLKTFESNMSKAERVIRFMYESLADEDKPEMADELNKRFGIVFASHNEDVSNSQKEETGDQNEVEPEDAGDNEDNSKIVDDKGGEEDGAGEQPVTQDGQKSEECKHHDGGCGKEDCCKKKKNGNKKKKK